MMTIDRLHRGITREGRGFVLARSWSLSLSLSIFLSQRVWFLEILTERWRRSAVSLGAHARLVFSSPTNQLHSCRYRTRATRSLLERSLVDYNRYAITPANRQRASNFE